jgi:hypothetical protein
MTGLFRGDDLVERELRNGRPRPADSLARQIDERVRSERPASRHTPRLVLPAAFTAIVVGGLSAVGGASYAASSVVDAAKTVSHVFTPASTNRIVVSQWNSGGDQYKPHYCWGCHRNHPGPPRIWPPHRGNGGGHGGRGIFEPAPPRFFGTTAIIATSFTLDEQADLSVSIVDQSTGGKLAIAPTESSVGGPAQRVNGNDLAHATSTSTVATTLTYRVLVPRTIPLELAIPRADLAKGNVYAISITARAPNGKSATVRIPVAA